MMRPKVGVSRSIVVVRRQFTPGSTADLHRRGDETIAHFAETLDLGFHDVAGFEECVGALAHAAAGAAAENIAAVEGENVRGVFDLLLGREDELRGVAVLLDLAVDGEANEQIGVVAHKGARDKEGTHRREIVVALAVEPVRAQSGAIRSNLQVAGRNVVGRHEACDMVERVPGLDTLSAFADGKRDLRLPVDLLQAVRNRDVVVGAGDTLYGFTLLQ